jgi:cysteine synthase B
LFALPSRKDTPRQVSPDAIVAAPSLKPSEVEQWFGEGTANLVVDLRGNLAFKAGHIANSINIPQDHLDDICEFGLPFSQGHRVLFVCPVGDQSRRFAAFCVQKGINAASLDGGFVAWRDAGKPIEKPAQKAALREAKDSVSKSESDKSAQKADTEPTQPVGKTEREK